jgi:hypothetical protein
VDAGGASAKPIGPLNISSPEGPVLQVNGGLRWPPLLLLRRARVAPPNGANPHNTPRKPLVPTEYAR